MQREILPHKNKVESDTRHFQVSLWLPHLYVCAHECTHTHIHTLTHTSTLIHRHTHSYTLIHRHTLTHTHSFICAYRHTHANMLTHTYRHIHSRIYTQSYKYIHSYTQIFTHIHTHANTQTCTHTCSLIHTHTHKAYLKLMSYFLRNITLNTSHKLESHLKFTFFSYLVLKWVSLEMKLYHPSKKWKDKNKANTVNEVFLMCFHNLIYSSFLCTIFYN